MPGSTSETTIGPCHPVGAAGTQTAPTQSAPDVPVTSLVLESSVGGIPVVDGPTLVAPPLAPVVEVAVSIVEDPLPSELPASAKQADNTTVMAAILMDFQVVVERTDSSM